jgi:hypothetical protein
VGDFLGVFGASGEADDAILTLRPGKVVYGLVDVSGRRQMFDDSDLKLITVVANAHPVLQMGIGSGAPGRAARQSRRVSRPSPTRIYGLRATTARRPESIAAILHGGATNPLPRPHTPATTFAPF